MKTNPAATPPFDSSIFIHLVFDAWLEEAASKHVDPYTIWSLQTHFRQFGKYPQFLDFLLELDEPLGTGDPKWPYQVEIPPIYRSAMPGSSTTARHITVRIAVPETGPQAVADTVFRLMFLTGVRRAQIGFPRPKRPDPPKSVIPSAGQQRGSGSSTRPPKVVLGVLDDGCPFGHPALIEDGCWSRVVALWDQTLTEPNEDDPAPTGLGYGRQRLRGQLDALLQSHSRNGGVDEDALYADPASMQCLVRTRGSHAAAVITMLAGRQSVLPFHPMASHQFACESSHLRIGSTAEDPAAVAPLAVVQFPREQINVAGARWLVVRALDGLRYLARVSSELAGKRRAPVPMVVNLSYGSMVGAHDGTALFETAMAELAQAHKHMAIVLAAGNSYGTGREHDSVNALARAQSGRHAMLELAAGGAPVCLELYLPPNKPIETYLEMWFDVVGAGSKGDQFLERDDVEINAVSPLGKVLHVKHFPGIDFDFEDGRRGSEARAGLLCFPRVAQSRCRSMALLVVVATQMSTTRVEGPSGIWRIEIVNRSPSKSFRINAWVERDLVAGARRSQAARLLGNGNCGPTLTDRNTFNNIATGEGVFRVGALTACGADRGPCVSPYSSAAADDPLGPEISAVADNSRVSPGVRVSGTRGGTVLRMNGTSVAAPQAARWIASRLALGDSLKAIRKEIEKAGPGDDREGRLWV